MTLTAWITSLAVVSTLTIAGLAFAQQPQPQPQAPPSDLQRGTGESMTNPTTPEGKKITTFDQPVVERWKGESMTNPVTPDGKPITGSIGRRPLGPWILVHEVNAMGSNT
jgi:hypothetical protein